MFDEWRERRRLKREIGLLEKEQSELDNVADKERLSETYTKIRKHYQRLSGINTDNLMKQVHHYGIELPKKHEWWWDDFDYEGADNFRSYLTDIGIAYVSKLIQKKRRKNTEWWVKIIVTVLTALTVLAGSIIGVLAILKK